VRRHLQSGKVLKQKCGLPHPSGTHDADQPLPKINVIEYITFVMNIVDLFVDVVIFFEESFKHNFPLRGIQSTKYYIFVDYIPLKRLAAYRRIVPVPMLLYRDLNVSTLSLIRLDRSQINRYICSAQVVITA